MRANRLTDLWRELSVDPWQPLRRSPATVLAAVLALAWLAFAPAAADMPAALYRAWLFSAHGFQLWDNGWYGGQYLLSYSVLYPPLAALVGVRLLGVISVIVTVAASERLIARRFGADGRVGSYWLAIGLVSELMSGRMPFALGLVGLALSALALDRWHRDGGRGRLALCLTPAALSGLASPVAALFVAVIGAALVCAGDRRARRAGAAVLVAALAPVAVLSAAFAQSGYQPFAPSTIWHAGAACGALALALAAARRIRPPRETRVLGAAVTIYLLGVLLAGAVHTPVGSNAARLGELLAGPLLALILFPARHRLRWSLPALALAALPLGYIQLVDGISETLRARSDGHTDAAYYQPLVRYLQARPGGRTGAFRVEIPFTRQHWESYYVATQLPLARGWERQRDIGVDPIFYGHALTAGSYRRWLDSLAVAYVAVPDAAIDFSSGGELKLINRGLPYLRLVAHLANWRVYAVTDPAPLVAGAATLLRLGASDVTLRFTRAGRALVRVRYSPYWQLQDLRGCVSDAGGFVAVRASSAGHARLTMAFALDRIGTSTPRCS